MDKLLVSYPNNLGGDVKVEVQISQTGDTFALAVKQAEDHRGLSITNGFERILPYVIAKCLELADKAPHRYPVATKMAEVWKTTLPAPRHSLLDRLLGRPLPQLRLNFHTTAVFCREFVRWYEVYEKPLDERMRCQRLALDKNYSPFWIPTRGDVLAQEGLKMAA